MSAPRQAESIPTVTAPVDVPEPERRRGWFLAGVVGGGVLLLLDLGLLGFGMFGVTW